MARTKQTTRRAPDPTRAELEAALNAQHHRKPTPEDDAEFEVNWESPQDSPQASSAESNDEFDEEEFRREVLTWTEEEIIETLREEYDQDPDYLEHMYLVDQLVDAAAARHNMEEEEPEGFDADAFRAEVSTWDRPNMVSALLYDYGQEPRHVRDDDLVEQIVDAEREKRRAAMTRTDGDEEDEEEEEEGMDETAFREFLFEDRPYDSAGIRQLLRDEYGKEATSSSFGELVEELIYARYGPARIEQPQEEDDVGLTAEERQRWAEMHPGMEESNRQWEEEWDAMTPYQQRVHSYETHAKMVRLMLERISSIMSQYLPEHLKTTKEWHDSWYLDRGLLKYCMKKERNDNGDVFYFRESMYYDLEDIGYTPISGHEERIESDGGLAHMEHPTLPDIDLTDRQLLEEGVLSVLKSFPHYVRCYLMYRLVLKRIRKAQKAVRTRKEREDTVRERVETMEAREQAVLGTTAGGIEHAPAAAGNDAYDDDWFMSDDSDDGERDIVRDGF